MDWTAVIERNREALRRVLAALMAMAGLSSDNRQASAAGRPSPIAATLPAISTAPFFGCCAGRGRRPAAGHPRRARDRRRAAAAIARGRAKGRRVAAPAVPAAVRHAAARRPAARAHHHAAHFAARHHPPAAGAPRADAVRSARRDPPCPQARRARRGPRRPAAPCAMLRTLAGDARIGTRRRALPPRLAAAPRPPAGPPVARCAVARRPRHPRHRSRPRAPGARTRRYVMTAPAFRPPSSTARPATGRGDDGVRLEMAGGTRRSQADNSHNTGS